MTSESDVLDRLKEATIERDEEGLMEAAREALDVGLDPQVAIKDGIQEGLQVVGDRFDKGELFLPEVVVAADSVEPAIDLLLEDVAEEDRESKGTIVIATVFGDIHDIGKNIVGALLRSQGYTVHDLGSDVPVKDIVEKAEEVDADIVALSTLLSSSMVYQRDIMQELEDRGLGGKAVIIGGSASNPDWAEEIGVSGYGRTVDDAIELVGVLLERGGEVEKPVIVE
jgi:corrinoid protein of di/trimethylamine methyltransferase